MSVGFTGGLGLDWSRARAAGLMWLLGLDVASVSTPVLGPLVHPARVS